MNYFLLSLGCAGWIVAIIERCYLVRAITLAQNQNNLIESLTDFIQAIGNDLKKEE